MNFITYFMMNKKLDYFFVFKGFLIYMMRRSADVMGGRGKRGGGLFGVMESTAKLINSNEIGVKFK